MSLESWKAMVTKKFGSAAVPLFEAGRDAAIAGRPRESCSVDDQSGREAWMFGHDFETCSGLQAVTISFDN